MLDSLVRVSRRVRWGANQFATDLEHHLGSEPSPQTGRVVRMHCKQSIQVRLYRGGQGTRALEQVRHKILSPPAGQHLPHAYNTPNQSRGATYTGRLQAARELVVALSQRGKCTGLTAGQQATGSVLLRGSEHPPPATE